METTGKRVTVTLELDLTDGWVKSDGDRRYLRTALALVPVVGDVVRLGGVHAPLVYYLAACFARPAETRRAEALLAAEDAEVPA